MTVQFSVPSTQPTSLALYDVLGRRAAVLYQGSDAGLHTITWFGQGENAGILPTGIYFLRLTHGKDKTQVKKVIWMR